VLRLKLTNRIVVVRHIANALVFLGLIGTVLCIWLTVVYRILVTGTVDLIATIIDLGEARAGA
jgi:hypothetical protein